MQLITTYQRVILISRHSTGLLVRNWTNTAASEYVDTPNYPPILDISETGVKAREKLAWHEKITNLGTYEQKIVELNMPKAYGYWSCLLKDSEYQVNGVPFLKFVTRTAVMDGLPQHYYREVEGPAAVAAERLAPLVEKHIRKHYHKPSPGNEDGQLFLSTLHRLLMSCLPYPTHAEDSERPRVNGWWLVGGLHNPGIERREWHQYDQEAREKKLMVRNLWLDQEEPFMGDRSISSSTAPQLVLRERHGLPQVEERILAESELAILPESQLQEQQQQQQSQEKQQEKGDLESSEEPTLDPARLHPEVYGFELDHKPVFLMPGYHPGEPHRYARLFYHNRSSVTTQEAHEGGPGAMTGTPASQQMLHKLLIATHTQGLSQAALFGFGPVTELQQPLVQQSVVTDGQHWTIALHQLNTVALHSNNSVNNPAINRLWVSHGEQLWDRVDPVTGAVEGLNKTLLARLATLYMKETRERRRETPHLAHYKHLWRHPAIPWYRELFREKSLIFSSGRSWLVRKPEIYAYEKLYRLDYDVMPRLRNNKRFYDGFRFRLLPQDRTCKMYTPFHIPVHSRALGKRDPIKSEPLLDSEKLFEPRFKKFARPSYADRYLGYTCY